MLPCGPTVASSRSPKLGAVATSDAADSEPPACRVATAISSPSGPFSDAVVVCDQTSVTVAAGDQHVQPGRRGRAQGRGAGDAALAGRGAARQRAQVHGPVGGGAVAGDPADVGGARSVSGGVVAERADITGQHDGLAGAAGLAGRGRVRRAGGRRVRCERGAGRAGRCRQRCARHGQDDGHAGGGSHGETSERSRQDVSLLVGWVRAGAGTGTSACRVLCGE